MQRISPEALELLQRYRWPGNVRELAHVIEKLVLFVDGPVARVEDLPDPVRSGEPADSPVFQGAILTLRELERQYALWTVGQTGGHRGKAAEKLDIDPKTLRKLLEDPGRAERLPRASEGIRSGGSPHRSGRISRS